jgi:hypothetical protein
MKMAAAAGLCAITLGFFGCAAEPSADETGPGISEDELRSKLGANQALSCDADSGNAKLALVPSKGGKVTLLSLTPAADLYALSGSTGSLTGSTRSWSWKGSGSSLALGANMKGKWTRGARSTNVTCTMAAAAEAASWRTASALVDYAGEIDGLAETVLEESNDPKPKPYTVFAVETARRSSLALGQIATNSAGALPGDDGESRLDENDFSYGAMSAAYGLGGGDDYGEWFQGASDGISLSGDVVPALGAGTRSGFIAHQKVTALSTLVNGAKPSAIELTVGAWTFLLPDAFPK